MGRKQGKYAELLIYDSLKTSERVQKECDLPETAEQKYILLNQFDINDMIVLKTPMVLNALDNFIFKERDHWFQALRSITYFSCS